ncbi:hypothetical protein [Bradyrhizobium sacchari]|uniref:Uncharacterized protein n=1 Tax=Bradyrhizobium sacchari TaxID=1399419 RepID=A0A560JZF2_9BRAD|nr:hypothetical protein [Bradyrhizobium sacchari]TWB76119.1 hypothetical protein FBZ95_104299 [Bradyrhizobium sacchari]
MAPKHHPTPLSEGDRKAIAKELGRARTMTTILAAQADEARAKGEALIRAADKLLCESWNERMWADGQPNGRVFAHRLRQFLQGGRIVEECLQSGLGRIDPFENMRTAPVEIVLEDSIDGDTVGVIGRDKLRWNRDQLGDAQ